MNNYATEPYQNPDNRRETQPWLVSLSNEFLGTSTKHQNQALRRRSNKNSAAVARL